MTILVTGGAGYIGSHVVKALGARGEDLVVLDNLSTGHREAVLFGTLVEGDLADDKLLQELFEEHQFESVLHFAGSIVVPESVQYPLKYYHNNTLNSALLLEKCVEHKTSHFIFSSTAAVYGLQGDGVFDEPTPTAPINPYGESKLMTERMLFDACRASALRGVALRYFNVAGADLAGKIGQSFPAATHLIKVACEAALGKRKELEVFGTDYPTVDGTCVRDYIHVVDLAEAHLRALDYLRRGGGSDVFNCGYGKGFTVKEVIERVKRISGSDFPVTLAPRRDGDSAVVVAKAEKIRGALGWVPKHADLDLIIRTAYDWEKNRTY